MSQKCSACNAPLKPGLLLCSKCGFALAPLVTVEDELRALDELGAFARKLALKHEDDDDDRREAIGSLMASAFVPETLPALKRAFLEAVQNMQPSHLSDDEGNTMLRNRCEVLLTKLRLDHSAESRVIQELQATLDKRVADWDSEVASEKKVLWMIGGPFCALYILAALASCLILPFIL